MRKTITFLFIFLLSGMSIAFAQNITVKGTVSDKTGAPLPGVTVKLKGTQEGTVTDVKGFYSLKAPADGTLSFSFIGYNPKEIAVANHAIINTTLEDNATGLNEVVVIGYGTQKKATVTGAISSVGAADLKDQQITRIDDALKGRAAGVYVSQSSGAPGSTPNINIRGVNSLTPTATGPLFVIDGVIWDNGGYDLVNPNDVESMQILKDASAAIYGSRASNGVILITTKKGKKGAPKITYDFYYGVQSAIKKFDMANATQYATLRDEATANKYADANNGSLVGYTAPFANPSQYGTGTNWQNEIFSSAPIENHSLSISGANDNSSYYTSIGYLDQKGIVLKDASDYKKLTIRFNSVSKVKKWLTFGENFNYAYTRSTSFFNTNSEFGGPTSSAVNLDPITPVVVTDINAQPNAAIYTQYASIIERNAQGQPYGISPYVQNEITNPLAQEQTVLGNYNWSHNLVGDTYLEIEPIKGLKFRTEIAGKQAFYGTESFTPLYYLNGNTNNTGLNSQFRSSDQNLEWNWDNTATYSRSFGLHNLSAVVGTTAEQESGRKAEITYQGEPITSYQDASFNYSLPQAQRLAGQPADMDSQPIHHASYFARVTYDYDQKYLLQGIIRRDGSSRFGPDKIYGTFPSVSAGWVASKEDFFPKNTFVDYLKIRGSYGILGNEEALSPFQYTPVVGSAGGGSYVVGGQLVTGYGPNTLPNPDLHWERTASTDIGLDATLFHDFTVSFDWYNKVTNGLLAQNPLPAYAGYSAAPYANIANMTNKGVELQLGYSKQVHDFNFSFNGNISHNHNNVTNLGIIDYRDGGTVQGSSPSSTQRTEVGQPIYEWYGYKVLGIFKSQAEINNYKDSQGAVFQPNAKPGDFKYANLGGPGTIGPKDRTFLGNPNPTWTYGFNFNTSYKQFDLGIFGQGVWGNKIYQAYRRLDLPTANYPAAAINAWTPANPNSSYPRVTDNDVNGNFTNPSDFDLHSGAYFRIKTLQLGYTLPKSLLSKIDVDKFRVYVSANNLATITSYDGYDPETSTGFDRGIYPAARTYMIGVDVTL
jgi:TonB-linked SusC/RagA family outer membrane protein